jgi:hypothetical protein
MSIENRFWPKVNKKGLEECWDWIGALSSNGYGHICYPDRYTHVLAHRMVWMLTNGSIPDKKLVLHKCDNPKCVNPNHLYLGSPSDNMSDREERNRAPYSGRPRTIYLDINRILELRESGNTYKQIAEIMKVSRWSIMHALGAY